MLINADVLSKKVSKYDRNSHPIIGDAATISVVENKKNDKIFMSLNMDGRDSDFLKIPAGGAKIPISKITSKMKTDKAGNRRSLENLFMKGDEVFIYNENSSKNDSKYFE